jgi:hypothetical protein
MSEIHIHAHDTDNAPAGPTWDTQAMQRDFEPIGFSAPFIVVRRRSDGVRGAMLAHHLKGS